MKLTAICDKDTKVGLQLAGIQEVYTPNRDDAGKIWDNLAERDDIGIIFITEAIAKNIGRRLNEFRLRNNVPIIIEIPDKKGRKEDYVVYISDLVKKTVGIEISRER